MAEYFDVLKSIIDKKQISDNDVETHFTGFMAVKWVSANPMACYTANLVNSSRGNNFIPKIAEYKFLKNAIKLNAKTRIPFDKSEKDWDLIYRAIAYYFKTNVTIAKDYIEILGGKKVSEILEKIISIGNNSSRFTAIEQKNGDNLAKSYALKKKELLNIKGK